MALVDIVEWNAGGEHGRIPQGVVAHTEAEDSASHGGDHSLAAEPCAASATDNVRSPVCCVNC